jgi:hypothetical protein
MRPACHSNGPCAAIGGRARVGPAPTRLRAGKWLTSQAALAYQ